MLLKWWPVALLFFTKVTFSGFLLGNREKIAVVANDDFFRRAGNMAEKMNRQAPTSNLQRDSKLQNAFGALVIGNSLVLGSWVLEVARETHALPFCHSVKKTSFAPLRLGVNPALKIKKPSQNVQKIIKPNQSQSRVILPKKFRIFFRAL